MTRIKNWPHDTNVAAVVAGSAPWRARSIAAAAVLMTLAGPRALAGPPESIDQRLLFDPAGLDRSAEILGGAGPAATGPAADPQRGAATDLARSAASLIPPEWAAGAPAGQLDPKLAAGLRQPIKTEPVAGVGQLDPRLDLGKFSVGFETETNLKRYTPSGTVAADTTDDTSHDPRRPRIPVPFIGLSAKTALP